MVKKISILKNHPTFTSEVGETNKIYKQIRDVSALHRYIELRNETSKNQQLYFTRLYLHRRTGYERKIQIFKTDLFSRTGA